MSRSQRGPKENGLLDLVRVGWERDWWSHQTELQYLATVSHAEKTVWLSMVTSSFNTAGNMDMALAEIEKTGNSLSAANGSAQEPRRGGNPADSAYLKLVGQRVRQQRGKLGMSRKALSQASGVSERYLAELERGSGNASLLVLRGVATALGIRVDDLARDVSELRADNDVASVGTETYGLNTATVKVGRVALIGLRGAGKTTLGRAAAEKLNVPFVELNDEIARAAGSDVSKIISEQGEAAFRALERSCLDDVLKTHDDVIVSTGGGIVADKATFNVLKSEFFTVWVKASSGVLFERARAEVGLRQDLLSREALIEFRAMHEAYKPMFEKSDAVVDTTTTVVPGPVEELVQLLIGRAKGND